MLGFKPKTKTQQIKEKLERGGSRGVSNVSLNHIAFRYSGIIYRLRQEGHVIETGPVDRFGKVIYKWIK